MAVALHPDKCQQPQAKEAFQVRPPLHLAVVKPALLRTCSAEPLHCSAVFPAHPTSACPPACPPACLPCSGWCGRTRTLPNTRHESAGPSQYPPLQQAIPAPVPTTAASHYSPCLTLLWDTLGFVQHPVSFYCVCNSAIDTWAETATATSTVKQGNTQSS